MMNFFSILYSGSPYARDADGRMNFVVSVTNLRKTHSEKSPMSRGWFYSDWLSRWHSFIDYLAKGKPPKNSSRIELISPPVSS